MNAFGVCRCSCVLLDVGLNDGKSLLQWPWVAYNFTGQHTLGGPWSAARRRLHDCLHAPSGAASSTCYYGIEANPYWNGQLTTLEQSLRTAGVRAKLFVSTAFSTHAGGADFFVEPATWSERSIAALDKNAHALGSSDHSAVAHGSTLDPDKPLHVEVRGGGRRGEHNHTRYMHVMDKRVHSYYARTHVATIDAAAFLSEILNASDWVAAKIDVEQYEYTLVRPHPGDRPRDLLTCDVRHAFITTSRVRSPRVLLDSCSTCSTRSRAHCAASARWQSNGTSA